MQFFENVAIVLHGLLLMLVSSWVFSLALPFAWWSIPVWIVCVPFFLFGVICVCGGLGLLDD